MPKVSNKIMKIEANSPLNKTRRESVKPESILLLSEQGNHEDILKILANEHTNINDLRSRMENNDTALHVAASRGHSKAVSVLMGTVINVHDTGHRKRTPLHCSAVNGHLWVTQRLLEAGATVDAEDADGATALHLAEKNEHAEVVLLLGRNGAGITNRTMNMAISKGNKDLVELCLQKGESVEIDKDGNSLVVMAAKKGMWEIVSFLLYKGAQVLLCQKSRESALVYAAKAGEAETAREILERGAKNDFGQVKWALAVAKNRSVVHVFLNIVPNDVHGKAGYSAVLAAATEGRHETLGALCDAGIDVNAKDALDQTSLFFAAANKHLLCMKELIQRGADVNAKNQKGKTPLDVAVMIGFEEGVTALRDAGAISKDRHKSRIPPSPIASTQVVNGTPTQLSQNSYQNSQKLV